MTVPELVFLLLSALAVFSALLVVTSDVAVHAALWLVVTLGAIAGCYLLMGAELVAWVQVLVYVGSVVVLVVFALMLTRAPTAPGSAESTGNRWLAAGAGVVSTLALGVTMVAGFHGQRIDDDVIRGGHVGTAQALGDAVFHHWVVAFEVLSVVLVAALVGAIVLSHQEGER